ncbi:MAG: tetratricopeptide repeat protein, partial [Terriglobales bacterium]
HYDSGGHALLVDPYNQGRVLTPEDCLLRLQQIYDGRVELEAGFLVTVTRRQMLVRMLGNLRSVYLSARNLRRALGIVDLVLAIYPRSPEDVKQRAVLRYNLGKMPGAAADFEDYVKMSPEASDADEVRQIALSIRRTLAQMN